MTPTTPRRQDVIGLGQPGAEKNWWELITERASLTPDRTMLVDDRGRTLTFAQYRQLAEEVAAGLAAQGIERDQIVSFQLPTMVETALVYGALCRLGARQNPVITMLRRNEVGLIVGQLHSDWLLVPGVWRGFDHAAMAHDIASEHGCRVMEIGIDAAGPDNIVLPRGDASTLAPYVHTTDVRFFLYSSGTTAAPKGVQHTEATLMASSNGCVECYDLNEESALPIAFPITHVGGPMSLLSGIRVGHRCLLVEIFDPVETPLFLSRNGATHLGSAVPFFLAYLAAQERHGREKLFPRLHICAGGGAPLPPEIHLRVKAELGGRGIINGYGLTECPSALSSAYSDPESAFLGTTGRECVGVECKIVTSDGRVVGVDEEGELLVRGPQLFKGYVDATLDAEAFDDEGYFRTGDIALRTVEGYYRITGRIKDIIIRNAENISAVEVENVLHTHPAVADVAVIGVPDPKTGERLCAIVVLSDGVESLTIPDLAEHCRSNGLAVQKAPERLEIIDAIPRNSMGKILKQDLRARYVNAAK
ncbi:MAG: class I adenylate-forming enzyme family protein [Acidimicrobiia bacterium]